MMKKIFQLLSIVLISAFAFSLASCHKKELKKMRGLVTSVNINGDTLLDVTVRDSEDSLTFKLDNARFNNGVMATNDSVIVDYIDDGTDTYQAAVVTILAKPANFIEPDKMKKNKLVTAPDSSVSDKVEY